MNERWKTIPGFEGMYEISDSGKVKRLKGYGCRADRILKASRTKDGYTQVKFSKNGQYSGSKVHRLVALAFLGERPEGHEINHKSGDKSDNRVDNLEYVTRHDNWMHAINVLGQHRGENHQDAKLTDDKVKWARSQLGAKVPIVEIANQLGVHSSTIQDIKSRRTWRHVQ